MIKKNFAFLLICLFFVAIITSACGGGKTTPPDNSAYYYLLAQQNANNDQPPAPSPTPDPEPTTDPSQTPDPEPTTDPSQTPDPVNPFVDAQVGDYVQFGHYPQTAEGDIQPIEWQVKSIENNRVLVISRYGLDCKMFDDDSNGSLTNIWADSKICSWLNEDFYNTAFDETEQGFIKPVDINFKEDGSDDYNFDGSSYTVFLLSKAEAENTEYFDDNDDNDARQCEPTDYAKKHGAYVEDNGYCYWWLRSPDHYSYYVYSVSIYGYVNDDLYVFYDSCVVRPALWIKLNN